MKVSKKEDYGIRALVYLALHYGDGVIHSADIAANQQIPVAFLEQLLTTLRKAGFVRSVRGLQGGHMLARPPEEITLSQVIRALAGSLAPIECTEETVDCPRLANCAQREIWLKIKEDVQRVLDANTIADLAAKEQRQRGRAIYYI